MDASSRFYLTNKMSQHRFIILSFDPDTILLLTLLCGGGHGASHELMNHLDRKNIYHFDLETRDGFVTHKNCASVP